MPVFLRPTVEAGILEWNKAFEEIGFAGAILFGLMCIKIGQIVWRSPYRMYAGASLVALGAISFFSFPLLVSMPPFIAACAIGVCDE